MILQFKYDLEKDIYNYMAINGTKYKGGNSRLLERYSQRFPGDPTENNLKRFIADVVEYNHININDKLSEIQKSWAEVETKFIEKMNRLFEIDFPLEKSTAYLTTADRCTYGDDYFFVGASSKLQWQIKTIMHELMHLYTIITFEKEFSQLNEKQTYDIKETMTELLNQEFSDLMGVPDDGYPQHMELREKFRQFWQEEKDIKKAVNRLIKVIKQ